MRYPTRNGLVVPPQELGLRVVEHERRVTSNHHLYWPRRNYQGPVSHLFRALAPHIVPLLIPEHSQIHRDYSAPIMPKEGLMVDVIDEYLSLNGVINAVYDRKTMEHYQITANQWARLRTI